MSLDLLSIIYYCFYYAYCIGILTPFEFNIIFIIYFQVELVNEQRKAAKAAGDACPKPTLEVRGYDFGLVWTEDGLLDELMCTTIRYDRCEEAEIYKSEDWNKKCTNTKE